MVINRSAQSCIRRWFALTASVAVALILVAGTVGGPISPAAADEPVPGVRGMLLGDRSLPATGGTVTEQVSYENLTPGLHYAVQVEFLGLDGTETDILEVENFTPIAPDGSLEVQLVVPESFQGRSLVAAVSLYELSDIVHPIAGHLDLADPGQTLTVTAYPTPGVRGSLVNIAWLPSTGGTITERVAYDDLMAGHQYTVLVEMHQQDGTATGISAVADLTPIASDGTVDIKLEVPATAAGSTLVAFVSLYKPTVTGDPVAIHHDLADPRQTVIVLGTPVVHGALIGERWVAPSDWIATERVTYENLTPGTKYTLVIFMVYPNGALSSANGEAIFTPTSPTGTINVEVDIPPTEAGRTIIATAWLFALPYPDPIASHNDLHDPMQTMVVRGSPGIRSSVADKADGDRMLSAAGGTIIDTLSFDQLVPGEVYTVSGVLMRQSDASATPLTSSRTFTAAATSGTVEMEYVVPEGYEGEDLVSFQQLYVGTDTSVAPIATDEELDDPTQTISVQAVPTETVPAHTDPTQTVPVHRMLAATGSDVPTLPLGLAAALLTAGLALVATKYVVTRQRRKAD